MLEIIIVLLVGIALGGLIIGLLAFEAGFVKGDHNGYHRHKVEMGQALNYMERQDLFIQAVKEYDPKRKRTQSASATQGQ